LKHRPLLFLLLIVLVMVLIWAFRPASRGGAPCLSGLCGTGGAGGEAVVWRPAGSQPASKVSKPPASVAVVRQWQSRPYPEHEVNLILLGDWGSANKSQAAVARTLAAYMARTGVQFNGVLSLGDNLYVKLKDIDDYQWQSLFEDMYDPQFVNCPFYAVLGNHDYEEKKPQIQLEYAARKPHSRWKMPAKWYRVDFPPSNPFVGVILLDSDRPRLAQWEWDEQLAFLEAELLKPRTGWMIVGAHHPLFSNSVHGDVGLLQVEWGTLFRKYDVDFYVSGHDHNLQHLEIPGWPTSFIVSGGGGRETNPMRRARGPFARQKHGFVHMRLNPEMAEAIFIDGNDGSVLHHFRRDVAGNVVVLATTGCDKTKPVKPIGEFEVGDKVSPRVPSLDPEPPAPPTTQPLIEVKD